ncbi:Hypothetical predicted protein, partial [Scomber scombrus]
LRRPTPPPLQEQSLLACRSIPHLSPLSHTPPSPNTPHHQRRHRLKSPAIS